jgi:hypothetical protein
MVERRKRQLKVMSEALAAATRQVKEVAAAALNDFHFDQLEDVAKRCGQKKFEWVKAGNGFIIGAVRVSTRGKGRLSSTLLNKGGDRAARLAEDAPEWAMKILCEDRRLNSLIIGTLFGEERDFIAPKHAFPVSLWPIAPAVLADLLLQRVMIVTFLNPGHLWAALEAKGFTLEFDDKGRVISARKLEGARVTELENLDYYTRMIAYFFMTERSVISLIEQLVSTSNDRFKGGSMRVELDPRINRFR